MAIKRYLESKSPNREEIRVSGSFAPAGTGAVTDVRGKGFTVARTGVGVFTVTLDKVWPACISASAHLQLATPDGSQATVGAIDLSAKTVSITALSAANAAADVAADADNRINFDLVFKNTGLST